MKEHLWFSPNHITKKYARWSRDIGRFLYPREQSTVEEEMETLNLGEDQREEQVGDHPSRPRLPR